MADHHWVHDHIASYLADGLDAAERTDLEAHLAGCPECARAVEESRQLDQQLAALFTGVRPTPDLEDRAIRRLRLQGTLRSSSPLRSKTMRFLLAAAAVLLLGVLGAGMSVVAEQGGLLFATGGKPRDPALIRDFSGSMEHLRRDLGAEALEGVRMLDGVKEAEKEAHSGIKPAWALAAESRQRHLYMLRVGGETNLTNEEVGNDPDKPSNYNVDRLEDVSVPGGGGKPARTPPAAGFGGIGGYTGEGREGQTKSRPSGGTNAGPIEVDGLSKLADGEKKGGEQTKFSLSVDRLTTRQPGKEENYYSYSDQGKVDDSKRKETGYYPPARAATVRPDDKPMPGTAGGGGTGGGSAGQPAKVPAQRPASEAPKDLPPREGDRDDLNQEKADPAKAEPKAPAEPEVAERKIIRSGELEFEVDGFDAAVERIEKIVAEEKGAVATINSDKLPNGKMKGSVVLRVPPKNLDDLIKKLRLLGELKRQRLGSNDVTKLYYDIDSRLKAARVMEKRLLEIIAKGNGQVKDLVEAEKELGIWRTRIEELEGEVRYYNNLVSLATLTIHLVEKDIRTAYAVIENRKVDLGIQVEDVEASKRKAEELILAAKARVNRSDLSKRDNGSLQATLHFEADPDAAGPLLDGLKQLGTVVRQDVDQSQDTEGGVKRPLDAKVTKANVQFQLSLYNLATTAAEQTIVVSLACVDVEEAYKKVLARAEKSAVRMQETSLEQSRADRASARLVFDVKTAEAEGVLAAIKQAGEVMQLQEIETQGKDVTKAKRGFRIEFESLAMVKPREIITLSLVATDVPKSYQLLQEAVTAAKGQTLDARLEEQNRQNVSAQLDFDVRRSSESAIIAALARAGATFSRSVTRNSGDKALDSKVGFRVTLFNQAAIPARETMVLGIEVPEVEKLVNHLSALAADAKGQTVHTDVSRSRSGEVTARVVFRVPLAALKALTDDFKREGHVSYQKASRNPEVPENELAIGQLEVTLSSPRPIVASDSGFAAAFRNGLEKSATVLFTCLTWVLAGLVVTSPLWLGWLVWSLARRLRKKPEATTT